MRVCESCGQALPEGAKFCLRCGSAIPVDSADQPASTIPVPKHPLPWWAALSNGSRVAVLWCIGLVLVGIAAQCGRDGVEPGQPTPTAHKDDSQQARPKLPPGGIDLPSLAFQPVAVVDRAFGRHLTDVRSGTLSGFHEGEVRVRKYHGARCTYQSGRLVAIDYTFGKVRPSTVQEALELVGLPRGAVSLDENHVNHLPFRAMYTPNPEYRNPIRCCGLLIYMVMVPEDLSEITVAFANPNYHFDEWPVEIRTSWMQAVGRRP